MILTWICTFCRWANDNNNGPCRKCGGHTEMKMVKGRWKEVTIKAPNRDSTPPSDRGKDGPRRCTTTNSKLIGGKYEDQTR